MANQGGDLYAAEPTEGADQGPVTVSDDRGTSGDDASTQGSLIFVDPISGELTTEPTAEQEAWLHQELRRGKEQSLPLDQPPLPFALHGGGEGVFVGDSLLSTTVIRRRADGTWEHTCLRGDPTEELSTESPVDASSADQSNPPVM